MTAASKVCSQIKPLDLCFGAQRPCLTEEILISCTEENGGGTEIVDEQGNLLRSSLRCLCSNFYWPDG
jgi:hypothetical protein